MSSFDYDQITNAQMLDWAKSLKRTTTKPLDVSSIFDSLTDAEDYIKGDGSDKRGLGKTSYIGQIITVYENNEVKSYQIGLQQIEGTSNYERVLQPLGEGGSGSNNMYTKDEVDNLIRNIKVSFKQSSIGTLIDLSLLVDATGRVLDLTIDESELETKLNTIDGYTVNGKNIKDNPSLDAKTIPYGDSNVYTEVESIKNSIKGGTHYIGVSTTEIKDKGSQTPTISGWNETLKSGDIVIYNNKEFIWNGSQWAELGDTTAELTQLTALDTRVTTIEDDDTIVKEVIAGNSDNVTIEASISNNKLTINVQDSINTKLSNYTNTEILTSLLSDKQDIIKVEEKQITSMGNYILSENNTRYQIINNSAYNYQLSINNAIEDQLYIELVITLGDTRPEITLPQIKWVKPIEFVENKTYYIVIEQIGDDSEDIIGMWTAVSNN